MVRTAEVVASAKMAEVARAVVMSSSEELDEKNPSPEDQGEKVQESHGARTASIHAPGPLAEATSRMDTTVSLRGHPTPSLLITYDSTARRNAERFHPSKPRGHGTLSCELAWSPRHRCKETA